MRHLESVVDCDVSEIFKWRCQQAVGNLEFRKWVRTGGHRKQLSYSRELRHSSLQVSYARLLK